MKPLSLLEFGVLLQVLRYYFALIKSLTVYEVVEVNMCLFLYQDYVIQHYRQ